MILEKICLPLRILYGRNSARVSRIYQRQGKRIPKRGTQDHYNYYKYINKMKKIENIFSTIENISSFSSMLKDKIKSNIFYFSKEFGPYRIDEYFNKYDDFVNLEGSIEEDILEMEKIAS